MDETGTSEAPSEGAMMDAADWQARAGHIRQVLAAAPDTAVAEALGTFLFADDGGKTWTFNGAVWMSWDGALWSEGTAPENLRLQPFLREADTAEAVEASPATTDASTAMGSETPSMSTDSMKADESSSMAADKPSMAAEMPSMSVADGKPADSMSMSTKSTESTEATAVPELPAMADSYPMAELSSAVSEAKPTELAADTADATWTSTSPSVSDKPADSAATTEDLTAPKSEFAARMSQAPTSAEPAATTPSSSMSTATPPLMSASTSTPASTSPAPTAPSSTSLGSISSSPAMGAATPAATMPAAFKATHAVPPAGMGAWTRPDPSVRPEYQLAPRTELMVTEMLSSGWAHVAGSNGWTGWVDGRQLVSMQPAAVVTPAPAMSQPAPMQTPAQPAQQPAAQWQPSQPAAQPATQWQPAQPAQPSTQWQPSQPAAQPAVQPAASWQPAAQPAQPMQQPAAAQPAPATQPGRAAFSPTHAVPPMGMPAWAQPNPALPPTAQLQGGLQVMVGEWSQSGWARVVASNGWSAWVDGRMLVPFGQAPYQR